MLKERTIMETNKEQNSIIFDYFWNNHIQTGTETILEFHEKGEL